MAERDLPSGMAAAIASGEIRPALFYEGTFVSAGVDAYVRLWTGVGSKTWDGKTWLGGGQLLDISPIEESAGVEANGFSVTLSGMPSSLVAVAMQSARRNKPGKLWFAMFDAADALLDTPYLLKQGRFDVIPIADDGNTATITAQYVDRLEALNHPRERRYTHGSQQLRSSGDAGFDYVEGLQDAVFNF